MTDYYFILGVSETATLKEIEKAYKKLALKHHPDKGGDSEKFQEIVRAYEILKDENSRQDYDNELKNDIIRGVVNFRLVPFVQKIIPVSVTLKELLEGCTKIIKTNIPYFFNEKGKILMNCIHKCPNCSGLGCGFCHNTGRLISDKIFCRNIEKEIEVEIHQKKGICNGSRIDCGSYVLLFSITETHPITLSKYDIVCQINVPIENFLLKRPFEVQAHEKFVFCAGGSNLHNSYIFPGLGLYKNLVSRGDLIILPRFSYSPQSMEVFKMNFQVEPILEKNILMLQSGADKEGNN